MYLVRDADQLEPAGPERRANRRAQHDDGLRRERRRRTSYFSALVGTAMGRSFDVLLLRWFNDRWWGLLQEHFGQHAVRERCATQPGRESRACGVLRINTAERPAPALDRPRPGND